jgi:hypothetical protein
LFADGQAREHYDSEGPLKAEPFANTATLDDAHEPLKVEYTENKIAPTRIRKLAHSLGLETLYLAFRGQPLLEEKKVVILRDLRSASYVSLLHIIPVAASITLLVLIWKGFYIGSELSGLPLGQDGLKLLGLQFASKMLDSLATASMSTILFVVIRGQLISNSLPFGAIIAGFEFDNLSFLWSKEFVATCATKFSSSREKAILLASITICTLLSATVGPSAAVASSPVLRNWPAGGTSFWLNATS